MGAGPGVLLTRVYGKPLATRRIHAFYAPADGNHTAQPEPAVGKLKYGTLSVFDTAAILAGECHNATIAIGAIDGHRHAAHRLRFGEGPAPWLHVAAVSGFLMTALSWCCAATTPVDRVEFSRSCPFDPLWSAAPPRGKDRESMKIQIQESWGRISRRATPIIDVPRPFEFTLKLGGFTFLC